MPETTRTPSSATFTGFPPDFLPLLDELGSADRKWFAAKRPRYQEVVVEPTKAFVEAMGRRLQDEVGPGLVAEPKTNGSISPITNDLRFAPDRAPYKDHLLLRFWEGADRKTSPTLFLRLASDGIGFATGAPILSVDRWRELVADDEVGGRLADALSTLGRGRTLDIDGEGYKRVPKPYDEDHPRASLLRHKAGLQARWVEPVPASIGRSGFVDWCARRLAAGAEVHAWFVANL